MCKKPVPDIARHCPRCSTDLSLLTDFIGNLRTSLDKAQALTRDGRLGDAVWAYLEVLEVDPENLTAREQVGRVVTAVRQFDRAAPGQRWLERLRRQARFRRWLETWQQRRPLRLAAYILAAVLALAGAFAVGYYCGANTSQESAETSE
jgi:hypothetical protein